MMKAFIRDCIYVLLFVALCAFLAGYVSGAEAQTVLNAPQSTRSERQPLVPAVDFV
jgi:hypothetical protein